MILGVGLLPALTNCGRPDSPSPPVSILHRGISGEPSTLDPAASTDTFSSEVIRDLYEGLTTEAPDGSVIPGAASGWEVDSSGTHYTFHLRPSVQWSDGKALTAKDFVASWQRAVDPTHGAADADLLRVIAGAAAITSGKAPSSTLGVKALDATTLQVTLEQPAPYFPGLLSHSAAYPVHSDTSARSHDPKRWVSNGPYVLLQWLPGASLKLGRNPHYWDREHVALETVDYQVVSDEAAMLRRYRAGDLDLIDNVPPNQVPDLRRERPNELLNSPFLATAYYGVNLAAAPFSNNVKLRQALAMAIDRKRVISALGSGQSEAYGLVAPGTWNYHPQSWEWRALSDEARIVMARDLYAQAGYSIKSPLRLHVLYNSNPGIRSTALVVASMWKEVLGIETSLDEEEYRVFLQTRHDNSRWQIARLSWAADYDDAGNFLDALRSGSPNNDPGYASPAFDALLDEAARTADPQVRRGKLEAAERVMLLDYPVIPLYHFVSKRLVKPYVVGAVANPLNHLGSKSLSMRVP